MKTSTDTPPLMRATLSGPTMGSRFTALFYTEPGRDLEPIRQALAEAVERVEQQMSLWRPDSELSRLNAAPLDTWLPLSPALLRVVDAGLNVGLLSAGAFDISLGAPVQAWGFGPPGTATAGAPAHPHRRGALELDRAGSRLRKHHPLALDLNGIAKGHGVDRLAETLDGFGIPAYLVGIDGEMRARGRKPDGQPWAVALEQPLHGRREVRGVVELQDAAIATSGDYRHWVEQDGKRLAHTFDPATAAPLRNPLASVSVIATSCMLADAWATALMVSGPEHGPKLAQARGLEAIFLIREGDGVREVTVFEGRIEAGDAAPSEPGTAS